MDLTSIKVPGKNTRDNRKKALAERKALKRPRGRPLKLTASDAVSHTSSSSFTPIEKPKTRTLKNLKSRRIMSLLEKLPTELLEKVFLYCMNLDLPRSSPIIAGKLSSEMVYLHTITAAFSPTWDKWHACERWVTLLRPKRDLVDEQVGRMDISDGDPKLQSAIFRCRWASLSRLLAAKDVWIQKNAQDRIFVPRYFLKSQSISPETASELTSVEYLNNDFAGFSQFLKIRDGGRPFDDCSWAGNTDVADDVEIPNSLLLGPWTDEMIKQLFWLIKSGAEIGWLYSTSGEVALDGLKIAITVGDVRAIHLLLWAGLLEKLDVEILTWAFRNAGGDRIATVNQILRFGLVYICEKGFQKIQRALTDMQDEAEQEGDKAKFEFVKEIRNSKTVVSWAQYYG